MLSNLAGLGIVSLSLSDGAGACVGGSAIACDDGLYGSGAETCGEAVGCVAGAPLACEDGLYCNGAETCEDTDPCTTDPCTAESCDAIPGCTSEPIPGRGVAEPAGRVTAPVFALLAVVAALGCGVPLPAQAARFPKPASLRPWRGIAPRSNGEHLESEAIRSLHPGSVRGVG